MSLWHWHLELERIAFATREISALAPRRIWGATESDSEFNLFLNPDVSLGADVLETMVAAIQRLSFIAAMMMAYEIAKRLARLNVQFHANMVGATMLYEMLDQLIDTDEAPNATPPTVSEGLVTFEDVSFSCNNSPALQKFSFEIQPAGVTVPVGPSGEGKTTVFALIELFYDPIIGIVKWMGGICGL